MPPTAPPSDPEHVSGPRHAVSIDRLLVTDFALPDVNPNSATHDQILGPRLYLNQVSAWYFGHAT